MSEIRYIRQKRRVKNKQPSCGDFDKESMNSYLGLKIKVNVCHELSDKIAIEFLTPTSFCGIGYRNWYFKDHFNDTFEFLNEEDIN